MTGDGNIGPGAAHKQSDSEAMHQDVRKLIDEDIRSGFANKHYTKNPLPPELKEFVQTMDDMKPGDWEISAKIEKQPKTSGMKCPKCGHKVIGSGLYDKNMDGNPMPLYECMNCDWNDLPSER